MKTEQIVRGIVIYNDKILLCKNLKHGYYFLPGGHIEEGESSEQAFRREMIEEIGKVTENVKHVFEFKNSFRQEEKEYNEVVYVYLTTLQDYENIKSLENHIEFDWISLNDFSTVNFKPKQITDEILNSIEKNKEFWI